VAIDAGANGYIQNSLGIWSTDALMSDLYRYNSLIVVNALDSVHLAKRGKNCEKGAKNGGKIALAKTSNICHSHFMNRFSMKF
jgi:hypothetical protein